MSILEPIRARWRDARVSPAGGLALAVLIAVLNYAAAGLSYAHAFRPASVAVIWMPAGLILATLLLLRVRDWPFALAGAFVGNVFADTRAGIGFVTSLLGGGANCAESAIAAWTVLWLVKPPIQLRRVKEVAALVLGGAVVSNAFTALLGAGVLWHGGNRDFFAAWFSWWIGDGIGMLLFAPVVLVAAALVKSRPRPTLGEVVEGGILFGSMTTVALLVLSRTPGSGAFPDPNPYMTLPFLFWAALRFGPAGAAAANWILAMVTAWYASQGMGPFAGVEASPINQIASAYTFLSLTTACSLLPAAVLSERRTAESRLRESEENYRELFVRNPHPMMITDPGSGRIVAVNDAGVSQYGFLRSEFLQMSMHDIQAPRSAAADRLEVAQELGAPDAPRSERHRRKNGTSFDAEVACRDLVWRGKPARLLLAFDVTDRKQLQLQLLQAQKMEAIGHLAGGIAHDFNNLLSVIIGYTEIGLLNLREGDAERERLDEIRKAGERAATLPRQLLAFSRKQVIESRVFDLNAVILDLGRMMQRTLGEQIKLTMHLSDDIGQIRADPGQIEQVVLNLAVNARDAMPAGGRLTIETGNVTIDGSYARAHFQAEPGAYVMLAVSDTGVGMDAETQRQIFDPFFTTKPKGQGTGLGLSTVYGIVQQARGHVWVYSELGRGTTFKVYLPSATAAPDTPDTPRIVESFEGTETILLVEDEEGVRRLAEECLLSKGYRVLTAASSAEALGLSRHADSTIHMLVTDVVLPDLGGRELARQVLEHHPAIRVLYMSGYTDDAIVNHGVFDESIAFLQKPFALTELWRKVREALDSARVHATDRHA